MRLVREWSVRHARGLRSLYVVFEVVIVAIAPLVRAIGYERVEKPVVAIERRLKGLMFDCRMCGQCVLSSTGMSCPMNCPKNLRNGPCGGVREDGNCEIVPDMPCVWVLAWEGAKRINASEPMIAPQPAVDHRLEGRSAWLRVMQEVAARHRDRRVSNNVVHDNS